ncbi:MAG: type II CAAX prenyl endopeptidase Rce1 family protein [Terriglobales bacterium]
MSTNPPVAPETSPSEAPTATSPAPVAPAWHTALFVVVIVCFAALSARTQGQMVAHRGRVTVYLLTLAWEYLLVGYVLWGARKKSVTLREIVGGRWKSPESLLIDVAIAFAFWMVAAGTLAALSFALGLASPSQVAEARKQLGALLPQSGLELALWLVLSATAGFCEEIMFRGYLLQQFRAATRSTAAAIVLQAVVFGIAHAYQGGRRMVLIAVYGALFGMLAAWRKSLRPGMIGHAMQDSFSGIAFRLLK